MPSVPQTVGSRMKAKSSGTDTWGNTSSFTRGYDKSAAVLSCQPCRAGADWALPRLPAHSPWTPRDRDALVAGTSFAFTGAALDAQKR